MEVRLFELLAAAAASACCMWLILAYIWLMVSSFSATTACRSRYLPHTLLITSSWYYTQLKRKRKRKVREQEVNKREKSQNR